MVYCPPPPQKKKKKEQTVKLKLHLLAVSTQCGTFVNLFHKIAAHCRWTQRLDIILALLLIMLYSLYYYHTATKRSEDVTM